MKLSVNTDFTKLPRAGSILRAGERSASDPVPFDVAVLAHDERHLRRKVVELALGERVFIDLAQPVVLETGDLLILDDGRHAGIVAAAEPLLDVRGRDSVHLAELAWHIGNRHLAAEIGAERILILRDHVIKAMLEGLGAIVIETVAPFEPVRGAYSGHLHGHDHGSRERGHGERDLYGRLPGDPHYGHSHG